MHPQALERLAADSRAPPTPRKRLPFPAAPPLASTRVGWDRGGGEGQSSQLPHPVHGTQRTRASGACASGIVGVDPAGGAGHGAQLAMLPLLMRAEFKFVLETHTPPLERIKVNIKVGHRSSERAWRANSIIQVRCLLMCRLGWGWRTEALQP